MVAMVVITILSFTTPGIIPGTALWDGMEVIMVGAALTGTVAGDTTLTGPDSITVIIMEMMQL